MLRQAIAGTGGRWRIDPAALVAAIRTALVAQGDRTQAAAARRYLKTDMPMFGVPRPALKEIVRDALARHVPATRAEWEQAVRLAWAGPQRELLYAAIAVVRGWRGRWLGPEALPLLEQLVREGAWWDLVDELATHPVGDVLASHRAETTPVLERWIASDDLWLRRAALLAQVRHREKTDVPMLLDFCRRQADDPSFWIRKAVGWALREHAHGDPDTVRAFLAEMGDRLSPLSRSEAGRHL